MSIKNSFKQILHKPLFYPTKIQYKSLKTNFDELKQLLTYIIAYNKKIDTEIFFWFDRNFEDFYKLGEISKSVIDIFQQPCTFTFYTINKENIDESLEKINVYKKYRYVKFPKEYTNELYDLVYNFKHFKVFFNPYHELLCVYFSPGIINLLYFRSMSFWYKKWNLENYTNELDVEYIKKYVKPYSEHKEELLSLIRKYGEY